MSSAPVVALGADFLSSFAAIPRKKQSKVREFVTKFTRNPKTNSINYEKIRNGGTNLFSVRIDKTYRGIVHKPSAGGVYILLWVDHHDEAYNWARRHRVVVHPETGSLQVLNSETREPKTKIERERNDAPLLFRKLKNRHLEMFGVPAEMIPRVREVHTESDLDGISGSLPEEALDCLLMFLAGYTVSEIFDEITAPQPGVVDTDDFGKALSHSDSKRRFWVVDNEVELAAMLESPLEKWRVFLHPGQRRLVERDWNGPVRVLGGAGTGKTVVAIHRIKWLAENRFTGSADRLLFTTFTKNLADDIRTALESITPAKTMKRIETVNLDEWVYNFLKSNNYAFSPVYGKRMDEFWKQALTLAPEGIEGRFFIEEWNKVILPQGIDTVTEYLNCSRKGRGTALPTRARKVIWPVFEKLRSVLENHSLRAPLDSMRDARRIIEANPGLLPYCAVVVDEGQDMGPQEFKLINAILNAREGKNSLFVVGDAHQRIYDKKVVLSRTGINIKGRSRKLRINYRTTEENRHWAAALLDGVAFDDLDGGKDSLKGYRSLTHGSLPEVHKFSTFTEELSFIIDRLIPILPESEGLDSVCIAVRTNRLVEKYAEELRKHGLKPCIIEPNEKHHPEKHGVRIATMHRVKGLEFDTMIIASANKGVIPHRKAIAGSDYLTREEGLLLEKSLLYVAVTRARKNVLITGYGELCEWLG